MDEISRVRNIKQRFEDINCVEKICSVGKNDQLESSNRVNSDNKLLKSGVITENSAISDLNSANHRANIKRTPAFRRDKIPVRNNDINDKGKGSIVTRRVHLFNTMENVESDKLPSPRNGSNLLKENIELHQQVGVTDRIAVPEVGRKYTESVKTSDVPPLYSRVKKPSRSSKVNKKLNSDTASNIEATRTSVDNRRPVKLKLASEGVKKIESNVNKENKFLSVNNRTLGDISDDLSDTLKRVLRSPLPPGPPPKKPPRTFTSTKPVNGTTSGRSAEIRRGNSNENVIAGNSIDEEHRSLVSRMPRPIRSKTESEIKLKKIENALLRHKLALSPKLTARKVSTSPLDSKIEKCAGINKNRRRSSDKGSLAQLSSCLQDMSCATRSKSVQYTSVPFVPVSASQVLPQYDDHHIYEDPNELNSPRTAVGKDVQDSSLYYACADWMEAHYSMNGLLQSTPIDTIVSSPEPKSTNGIIDTRNLDVKMNSIPDVKGELWLKSPNDLSIENKIKIWMNEAYSQSWTKTSDASSDSDSVLSVNQDEPPSKSKETKPDVECSDQVTQIRKGYVQRVASRAISRNQSLLMHPVADHKHLFECLLLIGLNLDSQNQKVPYIKTKYPSNVDVPQWIEHMCFPDAHDWPKSVEKTTTENDFDEDRCYVIPLTTESGSRKYVYCRRIKPEGESYSLPLSYCILSPHKANEFYFSILEELETRHGQSEVKFNKFIKELHETRFPLKGQAIKICSYSEDGKEKIKEDVLTRPGDTRLEDLQLAKTLDYLKISVFLHIFSSLLLERKVILLSSCISKLSTCVEGLQVALLPFEWQHTLITVVPSNLISVIDLCDAPTPYILGLLKSKTNPMQILSQLNNKLQVLVVDLDEKKVLRKVGDENSILPNHLVKGLKNALQLAHSSEMHTNNLLACEAFTRFFVESAGHYRRYFVFSGSDLNDRRTFQKEAFVKAASSHQIRMFLEWFVETAAFSTFINIRLHNSAGSRGLFEQRCNEYFEELNKSKYEKNNKLNKTVKQIGDLIKDWTTASSFN